MNPVNRLLVLIGLSLAAQLVSAQTVVKDAWVRGTVAQQKATGAFMHITSAQGGKLVSAASPAAGVVEIHQMSMQGDMMKMNAVAGVELPAGKMVELKPGGYHIMLMDLKQQAKPGDSIALTLVIEGKDGKRETLAVSMPVKAVNTSEHKH
ncbi:MAG: copper chaperone PCu(A)C [Burkholderiaceae bacterium]